MSDYRIRQHPIIPIPERNPVDFYWRGKELSAVEGETIAAALFANGERIFGHHHKDGSPLGIFCANGQCSQCMVIADGVPVKACMEMVKSGQWVEPAEGLPELPRVEQAASFHPILERKVKVLIIG